MVKKTLTAMVVCAILMTLAAASHAQVFPGLGGALGGYDVTQASLRTPSFYGSLGFRKFINSFASFQFPKVNPAMVILYDPLSRLEYPIDQWFVGLQFSQVYSTLCLNAEVWGRMNWTALLKSQDSDWEDSLVAGYSFPTSQKTTFSESKCKMPDALLVDFNVEWRPFSGAMSALRPIVGYRYQTFHMKAYGPSYQYSLIPAGNVPLPPGDGLEERFTFKDWFYLGGKGYFSFQGFELVLQGDYGWLMADLADRHLLQGDMGGVIKGRGTAWHVSAALSRAVTNSVNLRFEWDFKRITVPDCEMVQYNQSAAGGPWGWTDPFRGAKIWSDQQSIAFFAELRI